MRRALVIGCGENVWDDVKRAQEMCEFDAFYVVKLAGVWWPGPRFSWITLHPEFMDDYKAQRTARGFHDDYEIICPHPSEMAGHGAMAKKHGTRFVTYRWPGMTGSGSSGHYAMKIAIDDGFDRVVLAGVPMTQSRHFSRGTVWDRVHGFIHGWQSSHPFYKDKARSLSGGWTGELLGEPTPEWLGVNPS